ncbi:hypothetical protein GCM10023205_70380 [Yinghuangia aomiensis]|uniref:AB hydrolase-1 domain-containing protein n=1 Tax=Yinghuangia aomiensis TaxID=676205 RepID=A0ABP9I7B2_9ACTN
MSEISATAEPAEEPRDAAPPPDTRNAGPEAVVQEPAAPAVRPTAKAARKPRTPKARPVPKRAVGGSATVAPDDSGDPAPASGTAEPAAARSVPSARSGPVPSPRPVLPARRLHTVLLRDGAALHVVEYGPADAGLTVVLAHGWTLTHGSWAVPAQALADAGVRVVTYDQRGHGRSTAGLERPFSIDRLGEDLAELIEATVPTGPIVLGGHSMGGMTIMALAAARPELFEAGDRVRGVLLCATSAGDLVPVAPHFRWGARLRSRALLRFFALGEQRPQVFARGRKLLPGPQTKAHVRATRRGLFGKNADDAVVQSCAWMVYNTSVEALCGYFPALAAHDKAGRLGALASVPVRIVVGERDKLTPVGHSKRLAAELAHAELDIEPGCGHMVLTERPETVAAPLRDLCRAAAGPRPPAPAPEPAPAG